MGVEESWVRLREKGRKGGSTDSLAGLRRREPECLIWAEGSLPRLLGMLGLAGNRSPGWQKEGGQWNQNSKGQPEEGRGAASERRGAVNVP